MCLMLVDLSSTFTSSLDTTPREISTMKGGWTFVGQSQLIYQTSTHQPGYYPKEIKDDLRKIYRHNRARQKREEVTLIYKKFSV